MYNLKISSFCWLIIFIRFVLFVQYFAVLYVLSYYIYNKYQGNYICDIKFPCINITLLLLKNPDFLLKTPLQRSFTERWEIELLEPDFENIAGNLVSNKSLSNPYFHFGSTVWAFRIYCSGVRDLLIPVYYYFGIPPFCVIALVDYIKNTFKILVSFDTFSDILDFFNIYVERT